MEPNRTDILTGQPNVYWTISDKPEFADSQLVHDEVWIRSFLAGDTGRRLSETGNTAASCPAIATGIGLVVVE